MTAVLGLGQLNTLIALTAVTGGVNGVFTSGGYRSAFYLVYVKGDEATVAVKVELSEDGVSYVRDPRYDATLTGTQNKRIVVEPTLLAYKFAKLTVTPDASGTGTVVVYARRVDTGKPFVESGVGVTAPSASVPGDEDTPSGIAQPDASLFIGRWGAMLGTASVPVVPPTSAGTTGQGTMNKGRADNASVEVVYVHGNETNVIVALEFPLVIGGSTVWFPYSSNTFTASGSYHIPVRGIGAWERTLRANVIRTGGSTGTVYVRGRAHLPHVFS